MSKDSIKVISFDADGTLATPEFSNAIWHDTIPRLYARRNGMNFEEAREYVSKEYDSVGEHRVDWYDMAYWFQRFGLEDHRVVLHSLKHKVSYYPEVEDVLSALSQRYKLIIVSNSTREYIELLLQGIQSYFSWIFSPPSDYNELKSGRVFLRVCREIKAKPVEMVHVGDHPHFDLTAPREAGIRALLLDRDKRESTQDAVGDLNEFAAWLG